MFVDDLGEDNSQGESEEDPLDGEFDWNDEEEQDHIELLHTSLVWDGRVDEHGRPIKPDHVLLLYERSRSSRGRGPSRAMRGSNSNGSGTPPSHPGQLTPMQTPKPTIASTSTSRTKIRPPRWNWGIRSSSPPMEITYELYKSLQYLGAEWREKRHPWYDLFSTSAITC